MDAGPVTGPASAPSWKLAPLVASQVQGIVATGFGALPTGRALFLQFDWQGVQPPGGFLDRLLAAAPITSASPPASAAAQTQAASIAFSGTGLRKLGLPDAAMASFSRPFWEGMFQEDRLRRLGDRREGAWLETVVDGGPVWSANTPLGQPDERGPGTLIQTQHTVHALLLLYTQNDQATEAWEALIGQALAAHATVVRTLNLVLDVEAAGFSREHFGFADALSQPLPFDDSPVGEDKTVLVNGVPAVKDAIQGVPLGEFLIGYIDGHHEKAPGPVVEDGTAAQQAKLPPSAQAEGFRDLGLNGSYLVARELRQDVAAFWKSMEQNAAAMRAANPAQAGHIDGNWLAERVIGRNKDGHLLCPGAQVLPSCLDGSPDSSFTFFDRDPHGAGCPTGSHVRRAFPRDTLAPTADAKDTLLQAANNHRVLRRGRKFGTKITDPMVDDGQDRGLLFMCLNTDIERQFEFVQQTWLLNSSFATLFQEVDPLVGPKGRMTLRDQPLRRTATVETFVRMAGGDYFFLPSLPALHYLASL
jgi:deferrochelatase/peroxidase EfeB